MWVWPLFHWIAEIWSENYGLKTFSHKKNNKCNNSWTALNCLISTAEQMYPQYTYDWNAIVFIIIIMVIS